MLLKTVVSNKTFSIYLGFSLAMILLGILLGMMFGDFFDENTGNSRSRATSLSSHSTSHPAKLMENKTNAPLYWVAPMDDNYRRDKPGKSPMGMDLVPVYAEHNEGLGNANDEKGTVKISPSVVNNLGVRTAKVKFGQLDNQINTVGFITYNEDKLSHIHPRIAGWIEKLYVKATGDLVEKGQPLYELYSPELVNAQEEYLLTLAAKDKRLITASESRLKALKISQKIIDEIKTTRQVKQHVLFTAPQSGIVKDLNIREGFYVELGTKLFSIGDISQVWVEAEVFERQYRKIHPGDKVSMNLDYLPEHVWQGEVDYIYPVLDAKTRTVRVRSRFNNPDFSLKPNMFAQVTIYDSNDSQKLLIPKQALIRTGKQDRVVLALSAGRFKSVLVNVGSQDAEHIEVLSGLNEGDSIVVSAQFLIDSESSKTSDFMRMSLLNKVPEETGDKIIWTEATIENVMMEHRMATMTHQAIDEWDWPEMTMDFFVGESVDISLLKAGSSIHVEITQGVNGEHILSNIHIMQDMENMSDPENMGLPSARVKGTVNSIDFEKQQVNISRDAIEKWNRDPATLDFLVSSLLSIDVFQVDQQLDFTFEIKDGEFIITTLHINEVD